MDLPNTNIDNELIFSLQQTDDFVDHDQACFISFQQEGNNTPDLQELIMGKTNVHPPANTSRKRAGKRPSSSSGGGGSVGNGEDDRTQKKMVHREIERQRRQEMTKLYSSLRDLLPLEFLKGNRSISDHMHQVVPYIKQMEENVKGLSMKRDELKKLIEINGSSNHRLLNAVSVNFCNGGVEILIHSCPIEDGFSLSGILKTLLEEGLNVTSCTLTKVNDRLVHSIQSEATDIPLIDLSMLQQRLVFVANTQIN